MRTDTHWCKLCDRWGNHTAERHLYYVKGSSLHTEHEPPDEPKKWWWIFRNPVYHWISLTPQISGAQVQTIFLKSRADVEELIADLQESADQVFGEREETNE